MSNLSAVKNSDAPVNYKSGSIIFNQGQLTKFLYIVKKGEVRFVKINGHHLNVVRLCHEKDILNEVSILTSKPTEYAAIAKTDVELILVDQKDILAAMKNLPELIMDMFNTLCERFKSTQDIIVEHQLLVGEVNKDLLLTKDEESAILASIKAQVV